jgi:hypothetical protein
MGTLTVSEHSPQPLYPTRILNTLGRVKKTPHLSTSALMEAAERKTGLSDWGVDKFEEALTRFCQDVNHDKLMHFAGKVFTKKGIMRWLVDRLEIQKTFREKPEILEKEVRAPILIPGEQRAGTTLLQRLLALDEQFRTPRSWEIYFPLPPPETASYESDPRIKRAKALYKTAFRTSPALQVTHPMDANWPEECWYLLDRSFIRILALFYNDLPTYEEWLLSLSTEESAAYYRYYRKQLQILQWNFLKPRWVLKSPVHGAFLKAYWHEFPDAKFLVCHRHPVQTTPSTCSLIAARRSSFYSTLDFREIGKRVVRLAAIRSERMLEARRQIGESAFFDVSYAALKNEPITTMREIYRFLGLDLTAAVENQMENYLVLQRRGEHRQHRYTLEEFGLDQRGVEAQFESYIQQFQDYLN